MRYVRVMNVTTGESLAERAELAESFLARLRGLQGRRSLPAGAGLVLLPNNSVHMFFMRFPIDAIFVARDGRVLRVARALRPWSLGPIVSRALYCVELPAGTAGETQPGHQIELQPS
jgi:uncharacterized membrane protein (UPF0127 family)